MARTSKALSNNSVQLRCTDDEDKPFSLNFDVPSNRWSANFPPGTDPTFNTRSGVWKRAVNITNLFKNDARTRVGSLNPFVPESAKVGDTGTGKSEETGRNFRWTVGSVT